MKIKEKPNVYVNDEIKEVYYVEHIYHLYNYQLLKKYFPTIYEEIEKDDKKSKRRTRSKK